MRDESIHLGLFGKNIGYSLSKRMHESWLHQQGLKGTYTLYDGQNWTARTVLEQAERDGLLGFNVTQPLKEELFAHLSSRSDAAGQIGAVNVVVRRPEGWFGENVDGHGFWDGVQERWPKRASLRSAIILGAGGAARAVVWSLIRSGCSTLYVQNRSIERANTLRDRFSSSRVTVQTCLPRDFSGVDAVINATSVDLFAETSLLEELSADARVFDLNYANKGTFQFLARARQLGLETQDGLAMLVHQGVRSFRLFTNREVDHRKFFEQVR